MQNVWVFFLPLIEYIVNHLTFCLQTNLDIKAQHLLQTVSIFYQATAGMELTGTVQCDECDHIPYFKTHIAHP